MDQANRYINFKRVENQRFKILANPHHDVLLEEVSPLKKIGRGYESFSLLFSCQRQDVIPQGNYVFHNDELGQTQIFLTPIHYPQGKQTKDYYEAIFSYATKTQ